MRFTGNPIGRLCGPKPPTSSTAASPKPRPNPSAPRDTAASSFIRPRLAPTSWPRDTVLFERAAEASSASGARPGDTVHMTLYVGSLASHDDGRELTRLFSAYGTVVYAKVVLDPDLIRREG